MQSDDKLIKQLETAFGKLMKELDRENPLDMKVKVFNAGVALAKVKHAISEKEDGSDFNPDFDT
jgi:hypothetical protein